jgi:hypothetical protein
VFLRRIVKTPLEYDMSTVPESRSGFDTDVESYRISSTVMGVAMAAGTNVASNPRASNDLRSIYTNPFRDEDRRRIRKSQASNSKGEKD